MSQTRPHSVAGAAESSQRSLNPFRWLARWLRNVPVDDPLEWRNAPMLQILLLILGTAFPLSMIPHWATRHGEAIDWAAEIRSLFTVILFWFCFWLVRRGRFKPSAILFISGTLVLISISYRHHGLQAELALQATQIYPIVLGGLLLGRRALWAITVGMLCILGMGALVDNFEGDHDTAMAVINFIRCGLGFVIVAVILDRSVSALRETLALANLRGEDLLRTQKTLQQEIQEKERSQAQLIQAQKVEAVGRVSSGIAHDFNNILGVIMGYASRPDASESLPVANDSLDGIKLAAQRGAMAIRRILSLGRSENSVREVVDVRTVIGDMLPLIQQIFGKRVVLHTELTDEALPVKLDRSEFELTMLNIATNARDAMPDGGVFTIAASAEDGHVLMTLADNGLGMNSETRERLFDLFYTTKPEGLGSGIGLAVVKRFVDDAGGRIDVRSEAERGTSFRIQLPLSSAHDESAPVVSIHGMHILLVEDDEALRDLLADALHAAGASVLAAGSGKQAIKLARQAERLDVLVSDFHLPDATGNDVLQHVTTLHPNVRCLIISANENLAAIQPIAGQTTQVLAKPFAPSRLVEVVGGKA
ncbi:hybrid sensor histidine kinase/response regulator [Dyella silvatica]|uniref:hybrid sensor histidine kinase/response regulator n=1 Tax=Dyella silvatica TaxID=2992128 RepID=UPI00224E7BA8|nr:ATP-binding protein [Dyella silvatica]